jgi:hypothetical protein
MGKGKAAYLFYFGFHGFGGVLVSLQLQRFFIVPEIKHNNIMKYGQYEVNRSEANNENNKALI